MVKSFKLCGRVRFSQLLLAADRRPQTADCRPQTADRPELCPSVSAQSKSALEKLYGPKPSSPLHRLEANPGCVLLPCRTTTAPRKSPYCGLGLRACAEICAFTLGLRLSSEPNFSPRLRRSPPWPRNQPFFGETADFLRPIILYNFGPYSSINLLGKDQQFESLADQEDNITAKTKEFIILYAIFQESLMKKLPRKLISPFGAPSGVDLPSRTSRFEVCYSLSPQKLSTEQQTGIMVLSTKNMSGKMKKLWPSCSYYHLKEGSDDWRRE
ncbi:uncharacterized protein ACOB8E_014186 [Sarcophilus harrisii]